MKNVIKLLAHGIALVSLIGLVLIGFSIKQNQEHNQEHKQEIYELKTEVRELEFQLEMATMHIEMMNQGE